jgi:hypothetical protein
MLTPIKRRVLQDTHFVWEVREGCGSIPKGSQPCPYDYLYAAGVLSDPNGSRGDIMDGAAYEAEDYRGDAETLNKCYSRFVDKVSTASQWAVNMAEREEAIKMVASRAGQVLKSFNALRKGRIVDAAKHLGISRKTLSRRGINQRWSRPKEASSLWLEFHFGWSPLLQDIHQAVDLLAKPLPVQKVTASASRSEHCQESPKEYQWATSGGRKHVCRMGAEISVSNPNLYYANQLGLLNPASFAWELIPFSFVVDWFTSVGQVLNSLTDFVGLELKNAYTTIYYTGSLISVYRQYGGDTTTTSFGVRCRRTLGISRPMLAVNHVRGLSLTRGVTAISLVVQTFKQSLH